MIDSRSFCRFMKPKAIIFGIESYMPLNRSEVGNNGIFYHINWCRISSINSLFRLVKMEMFFFPHGFFGIKIASFPMISCSNSKKSSMHVDSM